MKKHRNEGKRQRRLRVIAGAVFFAGIIVLAFPYGAQWAYTQRANEAIEQFGEAARTQPPEADELFRLMRQYNEQIYKNRQRDLTDAEAYQQPSFDLAEYGFEGDSIGYIDIPRLGVSLPIYLGASDQNLKRGIAQLSQTSLPIGGENTNCVLSGHRGRTTARMFRNIEKLEIGDSVTITNPWQTLRYEVVETRVIEPDDIDAILIQDGRDMLTLVACHPFPFTYQRYVVYCERVAD